AEPMYTLRRPPLDRSTSSRKSSGRARAISPSRGWPSRHDEPPGAVRTRDERVVPADDVEAGAPDLLFGRARRLAMVALAPAGGRARSRPRGRDRRRPADRLDALPAAGGPGRPTGAPARGTYWPPGRHRSPPTAGAGRPPPRPRWRCCHGRRAGPAARGSA